VTTNKSVSVYTAPTDKSTILRTWPMDSLVPIYETVTSDTPAYNPVWYRVFGGYMHRARLQRVKIHYNVPLESIPETGLLGEVTVPYAQAYQYDRWEGWQAIYRLYYGTVHWIKGIDTGPDGRPWYKILDELDERFYMVPTVQVRPIPPEEIAPISPEVPLEKKRIDVNLTTQTLTCTENGIVVFTTQISSGLEGLSIDESTATPVGTFNIQSKYPSKHMGEADIFAGYDDGVLPGVPWVSFFTERGHAFHGAYWHDNFGMPMSHGCVNMRNEDAKWLFRWARPQSGFDDIDKVRLYRVGYGTFVDVHY